MIARVGSGLKIHILFSQGVCWEEGCCSKKCNHDDGLSGPTTSDKKVLKLYLYFQPIKWVQMTVQNVFCNLTRVLQLITVTLITLLNVLQIEKGDDAKFL